MCTISYKLNANFAEDLHLLRTYCFASKTLANLEFSFIFTFTLSLCTYLYGMDLKAECQKYTKTMETTNVLLFIW